jgi:tRNA pseudouridine13 synthase
VRIKSEPADFRVRELLEFEQVPDGVHWVHLLRKEKLSTQEALSAIVQHSGVDRADLAYAGMKDRQAITEQYVSIHGRPVELKLDHLTLTPLGRAAQPIHSRMSRGNEFTIVVRDLMPTEAARVRRDLPSIQRTGFPNYFDDQRFGCLRHGQGFVMLHVLRSDYETALHDLIANPSPVAITGDIKLKRALHHNWGDWETCLRVARGPVYRPVFEHLRAQPGDFRGALAAMPTRIKLIHSFAYQSFLWNRAVSRMLKPVIPVIQRLKIDTLAGWLLAWRYLDREIEDKLAAMSTPLYAPDGTAGGEPFRRGMIAEMENAGLRREDFLRNEVPGMVWKSEERQALVKPEVMRLEGMGPDEHNDGRVKVTLTFQLPRGSYATMLLKRLFAQSWELRRPFDRGLPAGAGGPDEQQRRGPWARRPAPRLHSDEDFEE